MGPNIISPFHLPKGFGTHGWSAWLRNFSGLTKKLLRIDFELHFGRQHRIWERATRSTLVAELEPFQSPATEPNYIPYHLNYHCNFLIATSILQP